MTTCDRSTIGMMSAHPRHRLMFLATVVWLAVACASAPGSVRSIAPRSPGSEPTSSPAPSAISSATSIPSLSDASVAATVVDRYESALVNAAWPTAWSILGPEEQMQRASLGAFQAERTAFFASVHGRYTVGTPRSDLKELMGWLPAGAPASAIISRSFLVQVDYPALSGNNAGWELFMVAPDPAGDWRLWQLR